MPSRAFCPALVLVLALAGAAGAEDPPAVERPTGAVRVVGTIHDDLRGLWLFLVHEYLPHTQQATAWTRNHLDFWLIKGRGDAVTLRRLDAQASPALAEKIKDLNLQRLPWVPEAEELAELRRTAAQQKATQAATVQDVIFVGRDAYATEFSGLDEQIAAPSPFVFRVVREPTMSEARIDRTVFAIRRREGHDLIGEQLRSLAMGGDHPFYMRGAFRLFRLRGPGTGGSTTSTTVPAP